MDRVNALKAINCKQTKVNRERKSERQREREKINVLFSTGKQVKVSFLIYICN